MLTNAGVIILAGVHSMIGSDGAFYSSIKWKFSPDPPDAFHIFLYRCRFNTERHSRDESF